MASENLKEEKTGHNPNCTKPDLISSANFSREITSGSARSISARAPSSELPLLGWPIKKATLPRRTISDAPKPPINSNSDLKNHHNSNISEMEMMKERFAKLLLGEDMSGSGKGVCTALAISNAITNLCASIFGQLWRLEPLAMEKKSMWKREMDWLLSVSDHIVELVPSSQNFPDGTKHEVMSCRPRSDIFVNLPALRKLDNLLLNIIDSFKGTEFWYVDQGILASECDGSSSFRKTLQRQEEKWWLPVPRVPPGGLRESSKKQLDHRRECTNQILKAAVAINTTVLADMDVPDSFYDTLPKNGRACLGDMIYRYITSDRFSPDCLLDCLDLSSEHVALDIANRVESAIYVWRRRVSHVTNPNRSTTKSSWEMMKDLMVDGDKREVLAERAERLLLSLKQRCPGLTQTTLDTTKIQFNKDVGKSILESYSRVLESLAFNIVARIDDVLYVDDLTKCATDKVSSEGPLSITMPFSSSVATPYRQCLAVVKPSPSLANSTKQEGDNGKPPRRSGPGVRRVLTNYLSAENKAKTTILKQGNASLRIDKENADPQKT